MKNMKVFLWCRTPPDTANNLEVGFIRRGVKRGILQNTDSGLKGSAF